MAHPDGPQARGISGLRVLVVEDELLLAMDYEEILIGAGCTVLGPVARPAGALSLLESEQPDAAVLDLNLAGERLDTHRRGAGRSRRALCDRLGLWPLGGLRAGAGRRAAAGKAGQRADAGAGDRGPRPPGLRRAGPDGWHRAGRAPSRPAALSRAPTRSAHRSAARRRDRRRSTRQACPAASAHAVPAPPRAVRRFSLEHALIFAGTPALRAFSTRAGCQADRLHMSLVVLCRKGKRGASSVGAWAPAALSLCRRSIW